MAQAELVQGLAVAKIELDFPEGIIVITVSEEMKKKFDTDCEFAASVKQRAYAKLLQQKEKEKAEAIRLLSVPCTESARQRNPCSSGSSCAMVDGGSTRIENPKASCVVQSKAAEKRNQNALSESEEAEVVEQVEEHMGDPATSEEDVTDGEEDERNVAGPNKHWTVKQTRKFLAVYASFKSKFDEPYSKKYKLWKRVAEAMKKKKVNVTAHQCAVKLNNMRRTYKTQKRPGAQQKAWIFYPEMEKLFSHDPVIELDNVAEVDDRGCPPKKQKLNVDESGKTKKKKLDWQLTITEIEKERVDVLKDIAKNNADKNVMLSRLITAVEKIADK